MDRRHAADAVTVPICIYPSDENGLPFTADPGPFQFNWTGIITPDLRHRIERDVDLLIALLDALDAAGVDLEAEEDGCQVEDLYGEPSLGWAADGLLDDHHLACLDREGGDDVDDEEDDPGECNGDLESA